MKLQAITLAAFLAVATTDADRNGIRSHSDRELGSKKKSSSSSSSKSSNDDCTIKPFPVHCIGGDLQPEWVGVKGEVCLAAGQGLCRKRSNWQFGITAPMPIPVPLPGDPIGPGMPCKGGKCPYPLPYGPGEREPWMAMPMGPGGDRRKLWKWGKTPYPEYEYEVELPLPYNVSEASAVLWKGKCDPVFVLPAPTKELCVGMVGPMDFEEMALAGWSYLVFKHSELPVELIPVNQTLPVTLPIPEPETIDGDYWLLFPPYAGGDNSYHKFPRLKLDPDVDNSNILKFKRGADGKDDENVLIAIDKDGDVSINPLVNLYFAPDGNRTFAFPLDLEDVFPELAAPIEKSKAYFPDWEW
mmetsp:Transcript_35293/g.77301  ORF Transcript_35293/g.77301 Transcript_35293/m.77301 type:complete len:356 (+) Transcript_35293:150-1217(+)|eukprot:CAMPEP_0178495608 /NCGR_PEP_ID=MMETSP0696-20121128/13641_1 /TAXON_ID=265572 /ORGANISM="Extubocellulus spinifer, Strain CCMP396" /LENGTH=355 /DNA_ID=CAMNT_0020123769 /DNA_START=109 /DNA_END=1176 /DNA_ORIENTATION=+